MLIYAMVLSGRPIPCVPLHSQRSCTNLRQIYLTLKSALGHSQGCYGLTQSAETNVPELRNGQPNARSQCHHQLKALHDPMLLNAHAQLAQNLCCKVMLHDDDDDTHGRQ